MPQTQSILQTTNGGRLAAGACAAALAVGVALPAAAIAGGTWSPTASMHVHHDGHTATLLATGNVVAAGGEGDTGATATTEVYNPASRLWTLSGKLKVARSVHGAALLSSGAVLVAGGCVGNCQGANTATAEVYNAMTGKWALTGAMHTARSSFGMVLLASGKVLAAGGCTGQNANGCAGVTATAELYNPATGAWTATGALHAARGELTATLTSTGRVLVAGGVDAVGDPIATAELYDPATGAWSATGPMNTARDEHTAIALPGGKILVAGGENPAGTSDATSELYDPATGSWSLTGAMHAGRLEHTAVLLRNGAVLVSGGNNVSPSGATTVLKSAELYNPITGAWSTTGAMLATRVGHSSTLLPSGSVLSAGGANAATELGSAEIYAP